MTTLVVVYDSTCGDCSGIAARLPAVLGPAVLVRSCRDPHLAAEFPVLLRHLVRTPCRRPLLVALDDAGAARVRSGMGMLFQAARYIAPGRRRDAVRLFLAYCGKAVGKPLTRALRR